MDANELATVAIDAMPLGVLAEADRGQVCGVLQMALRTLEAQHAALLAEADEETAEAKKLWREGLAELEALKVDRDAVLAANHVLNVDLRNRTADLNAAIAARDASGADYTALADSFATMRQERDKLSQQCDSMATELDAKQRELDEVRSQHAERCAAVDHLALCVTNREVNMYELWRLIDMLTSVDSAKAIRYQYNKYMESPGNQEERDAKQSLPPGAVQVRMQGNT